jgi:hypothetical protein
MKLPFILFILTIPVNKEMKTAFYEVAKTKTDKTNLVAGI